MIILREKVRLKLKSLSFSVIVLLLISNIYGAKVKSLKNRKVKKSKKNYRIINSDLLKLRKSNNEIISQMRGNVHFFYDNIEFYSDKADLYENQQKVQLLGNVKIIKDTITLKAEDVTYFKKDEKIYLIENVFIKMENSKNDQIKTFSCKRAEIDRKTGQMKADKDIRVYDQERQLKVFCGKMRYNLNTKKGFLVDNPEIFSTSDDSTRLLAEKIDILDGHNKIRARYGVKTFSAYHQTQSEELIYLSEEQKVILLGEPKFYSEKLNAKAKRFYFYSDLSFKNIEKIVLEEDCEVDFPSEPGKPFDNNLRSGKVDLNFSESNLKDIIARENVALSLINQDSSGVSVNKIYGDTLVLRLNQQKKLEYMTMKSEKVKGVFKFSN